MGGILVILGVVFIVERLLMAKRWVAAGYSLGKGIGLALVSVVGLFVLVYIIGQATASASVSAQCAPFLAPQCSLTIVNNSFTTFVSPPGRASRNASGIRMTATCSPRRASGGDMQ